MKRRYFNFASLTFVLTIAIELLLCHPALLKQRQRLLLFPLQLGQRHHLQRLKPRKF